jgi:predicted NAD/FAD-binding protein
LGDADPSEKTRLSPWKYQDNQVILHTDAEFMPPEKALWASWNFLRKKSKDSKKQDAPVSVSYYMNRLQKLKTKHPYIITLNPQKATDPNKTINSTILTHPLYSFDALNSQEVLREKNGLRNTWFCGSYFGYGFHEDAVLSSVQVANAFDIHL